MSATIIEEVLTASRRLLAAIDGGDWAAYVQLVDESITCFEPEALGHLVVGLPFHKFYFDLPGSPTKPPKQSAMAGAQVKLLGTTGAVVSYTRLTQKLDASGAPVTAGAMETRVWEKTPAGWKHVHFHRSPV